MLTRIIATKREAIAARQGGHDLERQRAELEQLAAARTRGGFATSLRARGTRVIAEVKRQSPSAGVIAPESLDIITQATAYRDGGAAAISVLTDTPFFGGTLEDLAAIADAVPGVPLLRKDFLLDEFDLLQSRAFGADAVLLITRILDDERLTSLIAEAARLKLDVLVEVHDELEIARAIA
ncbi:MAG: indole-3-glycerol-phosphate synthase, partial [Thermoleophilia bacterium]|nr:indole-3-glycerol-phosphate synthase [Thermoleophilia bacterium]